MSDLLLADDILFFQPSLAKAVGINKAIAIQYCHSSAMQFGSCKHTYQQWQENVLPWLSVRSVGKLLVDLEAQGLLVVDKPNAKTGDQTKHYRVNLSALKSL